ncbi:hypothetical protein Tco_0831373 [Tanacetum coccineum]
MPSALVVHSAYAELPTKKVKVVINYPIPAPTPLNTFKPITIDSIPYEQYTTNLFSLAEKKRKRKARVLHEVFVKENIMVDGMHRNLSLPKGVVGKVVLAIKEPKTRIFLYNGNFDLFF